jgi:hypothetical protein
MGGRRLQVGRVPLAAPGGLFRPAQRIRPALPGAVTPRTALFPLPAAGRRPRSA